MTRQASARRFAARSLLAAGGVAAAAGAAPRALTAQQTPTPAVVGRAVLGGSVRDTAGFPVGSAGVEIDGNGEWRAVGADGNFRFRGLAPGRHVLRVRALGFAPIQGELALGPADSIDVDVTLVRAARVLDTVRALAAAVPPPLGPPEFQERRRRGGGVYLTRDEFEKRAPSRTSDILLGIPGVERRAIGNDLGTADYVYVMRGVSTARGEICPISVYVDGRNFDLGGQDIDLVIRPSEIEAIEVYTAGGRIPARYSGPTARCGVVAFWTRGGPR